MIWLDGRFVAKEEAFLPISAIEFGEGQFVTVRIDHGRPQLLRHHLTRLSSLPPLPIRELIERNRAHGGVWRLKVARLPDHLWMELLPAAPRSSHPLRLGLYPHSIGGEIHRMKSFSYFERLLMRRWAKEEGWDDAAAVDGRGRLLEASMGNLFWVMGKERFTPDRRLPLYPGVTLEIFSCKETQAPIPEGAHLFRCSSIAGVVPVSELGGRIFPLDGNLASCLAQELECAEQRSQENE